MDALKWINKNLFKNKANVVVTSGYGPRIHPITKQPNSMHWGTDFGARGTPKLRLYAPADGVVRLAGDELPDGTGRGIRLYIEFPTLNSIWLFQHLDSRRFKKGDTIKKNVWFGTTGNTGSTTAVHLHLEVMALGNKAVQHLKRYDPMKFIEDNLLKPEPKPKPKPKPEPEPEPALKVGDKVTIVKTGNGSSYGNRNKAYGLGWTRYITKIYEGRPYPYRVGYKNDKTGIFTTGFYKADALRKEE